MVIRGSGTLGSTISVSLLRPSWNYPRVQGGWGTMGYMNKGRSGFSPLWDLDPVEFTSSHFSLHFKTLLSFPISQIERCNEKSPKRSLSEGTTERKVHEPLHFPNSEGAKTLPSGTSLVYSVKRVLVGSNTYAGPYSQSWDKSKHVLYEWFPVEGVRREELSYSSWFDFSSTCCITFRRSRIEIRWFLLLRNTESVFS